MESRRFAELAIRAKMPTITGRREFVLAGCLESYGSILDESLHDESAQMRANIKAQCLSKIERLKEEDGITVK